MNLSSDKASIVICPDGGSLDRGVVGVNPSVQRTPGLALLVVNPNDALGRVARAVRVHPFAEVPPQALAVGGQLAAELGLQENAGEWELNSKNSKALNAQELELEVTVDRSVESVASELQRKAALAGCLIHVPSGQSVDSLSIEVAGESYRVRHLCPAPDPATDSVYQVTSSTRLALFAPGVRTPVDIVVLADISGSMNARDVTESEETVEVERSSLFGLLKRTEVVTRTKRMTRIAAVKQALHQLLTIRLSSPGRVSRLALVAFDHSCHVRFPRKGGMAELNESSPPEVVDEYRKAVALLQPDRGTTNIGRALNFAGDLLAKHSAPGNDRLIVLISDGADWHRQGDDATGEMVYGIAEPVSLMESLTVHMGVRLQALGVSSMDLFEPWWQEEFPNKPYDTPLIPNHELLEELIKVGGGDPSRIGDTDVLLDYFAGLGKGVTRSLPSPADPEQPRLAPAQRAHLAQVHQTWKERQHERERQSALTTLGKQIVDLFWDSQTLSNDLAERPLFELTQVGGTVIGGWLHHHVGSLESFEQWWPKVHQLFFEARDPNTKPPEGKREVTYAVPEVCELLLANRASDLNHLRNWTSHDFGVGPAKSRDRVANILMRLTNKSYLQDDDEAAWHLLQLKVLEELRDLMADVVAALGRAHEARTRQRIANAAAEPTPSAPPEPQFLFLEAPRLDFYDPYPARSNV